MAVDIIAPPFTGITYVISCSASKCDHRAPARFLYTGQNFRHALANVTIAAERDEAEGRGPARVLILSAKYGLVELDDVLDPYDLEMGAPGSITAEALTAQALALGIDWGAEVYAFLPKAYLARLDTALRALYVYVQNVYEACGGIGEQRRVLSSVGRPDTPAEMPDGPGPTVWVGADVNGFAWRMPILVSYDRLRVAKNMPVALAPWVCDSGGFAEVAKHGRWTITADEYAADLRRYATEIGHLVWAAPQDWPAPAHLLARTGLTEAEHQARTIASVQQLRKLAPEVPIICVVTGKDLAGYLRHVAMYTKAGINLREEKHVVGVGALVKRRPKEAAAIIAALHAAGLTRLHGFGVKGPALDLIGGLVESIDSAGWSREARNRAGACPHKLVAWERNCPEAARVWAAAQRARAARAQTQQGLPMFGELFNRARPGPTDEVEKPMTAPEQKITVRQILDRPAGTVQILITDNRFGKAASDNPTEPWYPAKNRTRMVVATVTGYHAVADGTRAHYDLHTDQGTVAGVFGHQTFWPAPAPASPPPTSTDTVTPAPVIARRVTIHEARRHFEQGGAVLVSEHGGEPTYQVGPTTTGHTRETTTWAALVQQVQEWRSRYPRQRFYAVPAAPASDDTLSRAEELGRQAGAAGQPAAPAACLEIIEMVRGLAVGAGGAEIFRAFSRGFTAAADQAAAAVLDEFNLDDFIEAVTAGAE